MTKQITPLDVKKWKDVLDNQNVPDRSYIGDAMQQIFNDLEGQKNELLKKALIEKGFPQYAEAIKSRFSKVVSEKRDGWTYFFADNGTDEGEFIIAFSDYKRANDFDVQSISLHFNYHSDKNLLK